MVIKGYEIRSEIHRGPVTTVYDATHHALGRRVLLKVLNKQWNNEKDLIDRFRREAKICARLDHPNIVKIFDFNSSDDTVYISMEFIEGSTLASLIQKEKAISFPEFVRITIQILKGLSFAHNRGITHRDIKPSNIMISSDGSVKITDFGLAVVSDLPGVTSHEQAVGSPAYMSPEQILGKEIDYRSDFFSLGATLYKLITKKSPFEDDTIGATIQNVLTKKVKNLSDASSGIPVWFSELIDSLLTKERESRPVSADNILNIINSNISFGKINDKIDSENDIKTAKIQTGISSFLKLPILKYQTRIFMWILPVLSILGYLIFSHSDDGISEVSAGQEILRYTQNRANQDSSLLRLSNNELTEEKIENVNNTSHTSASPDLADRSPIAIENIPDTTLSSNHTEKSQLYIIAKPWAEIYIDSIYYEDTPITESISVDTGIHFVELKNPNYKTFSKSFYLRAAQQETLIVEMELNVGFLNLRILPWAEIYINEEYIETSPLENPIALTSGIHIVTLKNPNFPTIMDTIQVLSGKTTEKNYSFLE